MQESKLEINDYHSIVKFQLSEEHFSHENLIHKRLFQFVHN